MVSSHRRPATTPHSEGNANLMRPACQGSGNYISVSRAAVWVYLYWLSKAARYRAELPRSKRRERPGREKNSRGWGEGGQGTRQVQSKRGVWSISALYSGIMLARSSVPGRFSEGRHASLGGALPATLRGSKNCWEAGPREREGLAQTQMELGSATAHTRVVGTKG
jgi:hypothetical protein